MVRACRGQGRGKWSSEMRLKDQQGVVDKAV